MRAMIISGFPGIGKTEFTRMVARSVSSPIVDDSDSSLFSWSSPGIRNPGFPDNYIAHLRERINKVDYLLVSSHLSVRDALRSEKLRYTIVYPDRALKAEYLERYRIRGSSPAFIAMMDNQWDFFIDEIERETFPVLVTLESGQYLRDVLNKDAATYRGPYRER